MVMMKMTMMVMESEKHLYNQFQQPGDHVN
jgi:hypothetical protein